jgi:hypothetical protein
MSQVSLESYSASDGCVENGVQTASSAQSYDDDRRRVATRALHILDQNDGQPNSQFCHMVEQYRRSTGTFPLPLEQLPCLNCDIRISGD